MPLEDLVDDVARLARIEYGDPDLPVVHEVGRADFLHIWAQSPEQVRRTLGPHEKPAINQGQLMESDTFESWVTISDLDWDAWEYNVKHDKSVYDYERGCEWCGSALKMTLEYETTWVFKCDTCKMRYIEDKRVIGGTMGQKGQERGET